MKLEIFDHDLENPQLRKGLLALLGAYDGVQLESCSGSGACRSITVGEAIKAHPEALPQFATACGQIVNREYEQPFTKEEIAESKVLAVCPPDAGAVPSQTAPTALQAFGTAPAASPSAPSPAAAATAPTAPAVPTTSAGVELDKNLLPWDGRIHSSSKEKVQDGSWRKRRGVSDELVKAVESELRGQPAAPVAPPAPASVGGNAWPFDEAIGKTVPPSLVPPPPPAPAPVTAKPTPTNFNELVMFVTSNQIGPDRITPALAAIGISQFGALSARSDLIPAFVAAL